MAIQNYPRWRRHLEFIRIENIAIRSAVPENPTLEQNMKWIGRPVAEISPLDVLVYYSQNITMTLFTVLLFSACCLICRLYLHMDFILILC